jgi:hypothetical protein
MWLVPILMCVFGLVFALLPAEPLEDQVEVAAARPWGPAVVAAAALLAVSGFLVVML